MRLAPVALVALPALVAVGDGCAAHCDAVCADSVTLTADLPQSPDALAGSTVTFCVNAQCTSGMILPGTLLFDLTGDFRGSATLGTEGSGSVLVIDVFGGSHQDGDVVALRVVDMAGGVQWSSSAPVVYQTEETCGHSCRRLNLRVTP